MIPRLKLILTHPLLALIPAPLSGPGFFIYASLHKINFPAEFRGQTSRAISSSPYWLINPLAVVHALAGTGLRASFLLAGVRVRAADSADRRDAGHVHRGGCWWP